jgi:hypothetical protein
MYVFVITFSKNSFVRCNVLIYGFVINVFGGGTYLIHIGLKMHSNTLLVPKFQHVIAMYV